MAKKRSPVKIRSEDVWYRWECLKRNPDFLKDYNSFMGVEATGPSLSENDLCEKWALDFVPGSLDTNPLGEADVPVRLMDILKAEDTATLTVTSKAGSLFKAQWDETKPQWDETKDQWAETKGGYDLRPRERQPYHKSFIKVPEGERRWVVVLNPKQPLRLILEGIKSLPWDYRKEGVKRKRAQRNFDLRLLVYDHFQGGESIAQIARTLRRPVPTIWRAWLEAHRDIYRVLPPHKKRLRRLTGFNPEKHMNECMTCSNAKSVREMCALMRDYINQDYGSQRELTLGNTDGAMEEKETQEEQDETM